MTNKTKRHLISDEDFEEVGLQYLLTEIELLEGDGWKWSAILYGDCLECAFEDMSSSGRLGELPVWKLIRAITQQPALTAPVITFLCSAHGMGNYQKQQWQFFARAI